MKHMKHPSTHLKMRVLGAVDSAPGRTKEERLKHVASLTFMDEDGFGRRFTWRSIQTWLWNYTHFGFCSVENKKRSDAGKPRKVTPEQLSEAIEQVLPSFHEKRPKKAHLYRLCIEKGLLRRESIAPNTFSKLVDEHDLLKPNPNGKIRLAFSKQYANQMWQVDTMYGPYCLGAQVKLIAFIDDASRVICHAEFYAKESTECLLNALRSALYKRGIPEQIYGDNGAIYASKEFTLVCARLGIILSHAPVRDGAAKGKIERFFRTVREDFLERNHTINSLAHLNNELTAWVEDEYNSRVHSTLQMRPIDRFGLDLKRIRFLPASSVDDELFFVEENRQVRADNTFSLKSIRFETPAVLQGKVIQVRFDRGKFSAERVVVYHKGDRIGHARPVNLVANDRVARTVDTFNGQPF